MNKKTDRYQDAPSDISEALASAKVVKDLLPPPEQLALKPRMKKVTLNLSEKSIEFFKNSARKNHVSYQRMIQELLDHYSEQYH
jgi:predicted DNA binding CopG/RHH family protein